MERTSAVAPVPAQPFQFTIRSLLWLMVTLGMVLAFVPPANERLLPIALGASLAGILLATLVGLPYGRVSDAIFWSLLSGSMAAICIAGQPNVSTIGTVQMLGWPLVGAMAGAFAGGLPTGRLRTKLIPCLAAGALPLVALTSLRPSLEHWGDVALAAIVSVFLALLSELFTWARARFHTSYGAWAASLVLAVILGNWGAVWLSPILTDLMEMR